MTAPGYVLTTCCHAPLTGRSFLLGDLIILECAGCGREAGSPGGEDTEYVEYLLSNAPAIDYPELLAALPVWAGPERNEP